MEGQCADLNERERDAAAQQAQDQETGDSEPQAEIQGQLATMAEALDYIGLFIVATVISFFALSGQSSALQQGEEAIAAYDGFPLQFSAAVMVLIGALRFVLFAQESVENAGDDAKLRRAGQLDLTSTTLILAAAVIRLYVLLSARLKGDQEVLLEAEITDPPT